ncbi:MAG: c-type cytochrome [Opitutales bacterium]
MPRLSILLALVCSHLLAQGSIAVPRGFVAETVYTVPKATQGSWISLAVAPNGDLVAGDQGGGLWRIALADPTKPVVTPIPIQAKGAHGLLFVDGALYLIAGEGRDNGIWRLRDTKGDGSFSEQVLLRRLEGRGEHGPHQLALDRDGTLLVIAGNHTKLPPDEIPGPKPHWDEDTLLERFEDPNGHAVGIRATGGWIARMNKDGTGWQRVTVGMRNAYDLAVAPDGDIFTYDSDMEWDMGAPWYRPTRIYLATPGGELGWRSGSACIPEPTIDTQPPILDIGPGSPTGVAFGTGAKFPARYQRAFFACDWTYGTLYAIHLTPDGAAWKAKKEIFATGKPLPLTDVVIRPQDGALYLTVGGRGTQSALYRIRYTGTEPTAPVAWHEATPEQKLRRELEQLRLSTIPMKALDKAWPLMGHKDPWIRYAARIVVEAQPVELWKKALSAHSLNSVQGLNAALAYARCTKSFSEEDNLLVNDRGVPVGLTNQETRDLLRISEVFNYRASMAGSPIQLLREDFIGVSAAHRLASYDDGLCRQSLQYIIAQGQVAAPAIALQLMRGAKGKPALQVDGDLLARNDTYAKDVNAALAVTPTTIRIGLAVYLARAKVGWTPELRREFFDMLDEMAETKGGHSLRGFVVNIRKAALENVPEAERAEYAPRAPSKPAEARPTAKGPGRSWTEDDALAAWKQAKDHDFENGRRMFEAAACSMCHRVGELGGAQAPDLTGVGSRMTTTDLIQSILKPSAVISDQYGHSAVYRRDGSKVLGRVVSDAADKVEIAINPFDPAVQVTVNRSDVVSIERWAVSPMPEGLANTLSAKELTDLLAYLQSGGKKSDPLYRK